MKYLTKTIKLLPLTLLLGIVGCNEEIYLDRLNVKHVRVAPKLYEDVNPIVTFCVSEEYIQYPGNSETDISVELADGTLSDGVNFYTWYLTEDLKSTYYKGLLNINDYPEYQECGLGKKYPYIYVFKVNLHPHIRKVKELDIISKQLLTNKQFAVRPNHGDMNGDRIMSSEKYILPFTDEQIEKMLAAYNNPRFNKTLPQP